MQTRMQRIIASFTALAVLAVSFNCVCAGMTPANRAAPMSCCASHHGQHCKHQSSKSSPCSAGCEHCTLTAMNDTVANPSQHVDQIVSHLIAAPTGQFDLPAVLTTDTGNGITDTPALCPTPGACTLLSMHCALII